MRSDNMLVKVCGMREAENIREVEALGIDMMGFIFYGKSSRYAGTVPPEYLPSSCRRVGVFVNADADLIRTMVDSFRLDMVQLHGDESPDFCRSLLAAIPGISLVKAFSIASAGDLDKTSEYEGLVDFFLFDTATKGYGGSGRSFDWTLLASYHGQVPFLLSGGIGEESVGQLRGFSHPMWAGVDLNSRFEQAPGLKDVDAIGRFIEEFRK